jgi:hypothetical protein
MFFVQAEMNAANVTWEFTDYSQTLHSFTNPTTMVSASVSKRRLSTFNKAFVQEGSLNLLGAPFSSQGVLRALREGLERPIPIKKECSVSPGGDGVVSRLLDSPTVLKYEESNSHPTCFCLFSRPS